MYDKLFPNFFDLLSLERDITAVQARLRQLDRLRELVEEIGSDDAVASQLAAWQHASAELDEQKHALDRQRAEKADAQNELFANRTRLVAMLQQLDYSRPTDLPSDPPLTEEAASLSVAELPDAHRRLTERVRDNQREYRNVQDELVEPRTQLEARYDREAPDESFDE